MELDPESEILKTNLYKNKENVLKRKEQQLHQRK